MLIVVTFDLRASPLEVFHQNARLLFQNQASTDESVCRVYEVGRMRRADEEDEQVREV